MRPRDICVSKFSANKKTNREGETKSYALIRYRSRRFLSPKNDFDWFWPSTAMPEDSEEEWWNNCAVGWNTASKHDTLRK